MRLVGTQSTQKDTEIVSGWICHSRLIQPQKAWMEILTNQLFFFGWSYTHLGNTFEHAPGRAPGRSGAGHAFASVLAALAAPRLQRAARPLQRGGPWTCAARRGGGPWGEVRRVAEMTWKMGIYSESANKRWKTFGKRDGKRLEKEWKSRFHFLRCCGFFRPFLHFWGVSRWWNGLL